MRENRFGFFSAALLLLAACGVVPPPPAVPAPPAEAHPLFLLADGKALAPAGGPGTALYVGDLVASSETESLVFRDSGNRVVRLFPGARVRLAEGPERIRVETGAVLAAVRPGNSFTVGTRVASAGVRGTVFFVETRGESEAYVCVCEGEVEIADGSDSSLARLRAAPGGPHHAVTAGLAGVRPAAMVNHTDSDVVSLRGLIGR